MRYFYVPALFLISGLTAGWLIGAGLRGWLPQGATTAASDARDARIIRDYGALPLGFEINQGQTDPQVKFFVRGAGYAMFLTAQEAVLVLGRRDAAIKDNMALRMRFEGANANPVMQGIEPLPGKSHYFKGKHPRHWHTDVPRFARVNYESVYPGVDLVYYGNQSQLEYDLVVAPGADPGAIRMAFTGATGMHVNAFGDLVLATPAGELVQKRPLVYQQVQDRRKLVAAGYRLFKGDNGERVVGFDLAHYDTAQPLIIDPVLVYATYLGGTADDFGIGIAVDGGGHAYVTGNTASLVFPAGAGTPFQANNGGGTDVFIAKLAADGGSLEYASYLGGTDNDFVRGIAVDGGGNAYVTGTTFSPNFPNNNLLKGPDPCCFADAFIAKLNATGSALVYSTLLGGSDDDFGRGIAVDVGGNAYVTGETFSLDFPNNNLLKGPDPCCFDAFVTKLDAAGSTLVYSTLLGGSDDDFGRAIAVDGGGSAYIAGETVSTDFPTLGPVPGQGPDPCCVDGFVTKLNAAGTALAYSTYLGGVDDDSLSGVAVDAAGNAYVTGQTLSDDFPTVVPVQPVKGVFEDVVVAKLNATGSALVYSTFLGGSGSDFGNDIAVDGNGNAHVTGETFSSDFPAVNALSAGSPRISNAFISKFSVIGSVLDYSTLLGGEGAADASIGIAVDAVSNAYIVGLTNSTNFRSINSLQPANAGGFDAFVAKISPAAGSGGGGGGGISGSSDDDDGGGGGATDMQLLLLLASLALAVRRKTGPA